MRDTTDSSSSPTCRLHQRSRSRWPLPSSAWASPSASWTTTRPSAPGPFLLLAPLSYVCHPLAHPPPLRSHRPPLPPSPSLHASHKQLKREGYLCPQCETKCCELPTECPVCGLTLVSSSHLARSYHHLFPLPAFEAVRLDPGYASAFPIYPNLYASRFIIFIVGRRWSATDVVSGWAGRWAWRRTPVRDVVSGIASDARYSCTTSSTRAPDARCDHEERRLPIIIIMFIVFLLSWYGYMCIVEEGWGSRYTYVVATTKEREEGAMKGRGGGLTHHHQFWGRRGSRRRERSKRSFSSKWGSSRRNVWMGSIT